ncbi:MAG TPA: methyltransferase [Polyangia bacterium]|nr:methyltransferase [Polyangia bacterium]
MLTSTPSEPERRGDQSGTLGGFPDPPATDSARAEPELRPRDQSGTLGGFPDPPATDSARAEPELRPRETTTDTLLRGRITLLQPARGFRSSLDPVLLAGFLAPPFGRMLDIGCGTGALAFLLLTADPNSSGVAVELQPRLARLARAGAARNGFASRLAVIEGDVAALADADLPSASFDLVATNPPFRRTSAGLPSPDGEKARAHHEITLTLPQWSAVAARVVRPGGRVAAIFAAERLGELLAQLDADGLAAARVRAVHPEADRPATRVLVEARRAPRASLVLEPPLVVHGTHGTGRRFSEEVARMLGEA